MSLTNEGTLDPAQATPRDTDIELEGIENAKPFLDHILYVGTLTELGGKQFVNTEQRNLLIFTLDGFFEDVQKYVQSAVLEARISELKNTMIQTETGDVSIWVYKWAKNRIMDLRSGLNRKEDKSG